jgi:hypothetical protein
MPNKPYDVLKEYEVDFDQEKSWKSISSRLNTSYSFWKFSIRSFNAYYCAGLIFVAGICAYYAIPSKSSSEIKQDTVVDEKNTSSSLNHSISEDDKVNNKIKSLKDSKDKTISATENNNKAIQANRENEKISPQTNQVINFSNLDLDSVADRKDQLLVNPQNKDKNNSALVKRDSVVSTPRKKIYVSRKDTIYKTDTVYKKPVTRKR